MQSIWAGPLLVVADARAIRPTVPAARPLSRSNQATAFASTLRSSLADLAAPSMPRSMATRDGVSTKELR